MTTIYAKTKKGMDEMLARRPSIDKLLNSILVLVDGKRTDEEIQRTLERLQAPKDGLVILMRGGYIEPCDVSEAPKTITQAQAPGKAAQTGGTSTAFLNTYRYAVNQTRQRLGIRGFSYQLKLERATTIDELRTVIEPLTQAIEKFQGTQAAQEFMHGCEEHMDPQAAREVGRRLVEDARALQARKLRSQREA